MRCEDMEAGVVMWPELHEGGLSLPTNSVDDAFQPPGGRARGSPMAGLDLPSRPAVTPNPQSYYCQAFSHFLERGGGLQDSTRKAWNQPFPKRGERGRLEWW